MTALPQGDAETPARVPAGWRPGDPTSIATSLEGSKKEGVDGGPHSRAVTGVSPIASGNGKPPSGVPALAVPAGTGAPVEALRALL